jgi:hypothetical protein
LRCGCCRKENDQLAFRASDVQLPYKEQSFQDNVLILMPISFLQSPAVSLCGFFDRLGFLANEYSSQPEPSRPMHPHPMSRNVCPSIVSRSTKRIKDFPTSSILVSSIFSAYCDQFSPNENEF